MKKKILLLIALLLFIPKEVLAEESITLKNTIDKITNPIDSEIIYKIKPHAENQKESENEPDNIKVSFKDIEVEENTLTAETTIDFSNTTYKYPGTYRYGIMQKSTDDESINLVKDTYEIYVTVTQETDGTLKTDVSPLVFDFENLEKDELKFTNTVNYTNMIIENKIKGDYKDSYIKYKLTLYGKVGSKFTITGQDEEVNYNGEKIITSNEYTITEEDNYVYLYLKDSQSVTIGINELEFNEIPLKTEYKLEVEDWEKWDIRIDKQEERIKRGVLGEDNHIIITLERTFDSAVTGLFYTIIPFIILIVISIVSIIFIPKMKKM